MATSPPSSLPSILGLTLTLDPASAVWPTTLATLRAHAGVTLDEPRMPFVALALETDDPRRDHAWLESLPGVVAVDVAFVEVLADVPSTHPRPRSHDPRDDAPLPPG